MHASTGVYIVSVRLFLPIRDLPVGPDSDVMGLRGYREVNGPVLSKAA